MNFAWIYLFVGVYIYAGCVGIATTTLFAGYGAHAVGYQVSAQLAQFGVFAVLVISAAKVFGAACLAWSKSPITRCAGGVVATLCAVVTGCAGWWILMIWSEPMIADGRYAAYAALWGVSPRAMQAFDAAVNVSAIEAMSVGGLYVSAIFAVFDEHRTSATAAA